MECRLVSHRSLVGWTCCAVSYLFWLNILIEHHGLWLSEQLINEGIVMEVDDGYICVSCGKRRKMLSKMRIHLISHGINNEYPCPFCERVPTSQDSRKRHIQTIHKKTQLQADPSIAQISRPILDNHEWMMNKKWNHHKCYEFFISDAKISIFIVMIDLVFQLWFF